MCIRDRASSVYDGCDAVMLSGETAAGKYPVEAVKMMNRVCLNAEAHHMLLEVKTVYEYVHEYSLTDAVAHACCDMAKQLEAKAIITATSGGSTARMVAKYRPDCQIIASTQHPSVYQKLSLLWGVEPVISGVLDVYKRQGYTCPRCGRVLDHDVVLYDDNLALLPMALRLAGSAQELLVVGTSFYTSTSSYVTDYARDRGARITIINQDAAHEVPAYLKRLHII